MLSSRLGHFFDTPLSSLAKRINVTPDLITVAGFLVTVLAAFTLPRNLMLGGLLILAGGFFDVLDGVVARVNNRVTGFGAFLDSVLDRYSDSFLFLGLAWYFFRTDSVTGVVMSLGTMIGALLISYTRARAEGLGEDCKVGLMERPERIVLMAFGAITGWIEPVIGIMFVLTHVTVIQRVYHVWKSMK